MRCLIHSVKQKGCNPKRVDASFEAELLDAVLVLFVEALIAQEKIVVRNAQATICEALARA